MSNQASESNSATEVLKNENLSVSVTKAPNCQVKFDIEVSPPAVLAAYQKAIKNVSKSISIPGFRKGKAPEAMILEKYDSAIEREFVDIVVQTGFNDAIYLTHIYPLKDGRSKKPILHECSTDKGARFTIEFESRPTFPEINLADLHIKKTLLKQITEEERENSIHHLQLQLAEYEPVENRSVEENDFVNLTVKILEEVPRTVIDNQRCQINSKGLPSWLCQMVIGLKAGEKAEGMTEQDPQSKAENHHFTPLPCSVEVHSIHVGKLPEFNDALAKRVGLKTAEELSEKINERLESQIKEEAERNDIEYALQQLLDKYPIEIPQSYIDVNKEARIKEYYQRLDKKEKSSVNRQEIEKMIEHQTISHLQINFLMKKIANDHGIVINNEDITAELQKQITSMQQGESFIDFGDQEKLREQLYHLAMDRKIKQFILRECL